MSNGNIPKKYAEVNIPIPAAQAFKSSDDAAILSQAAILLGLGIKLRGDDSMLSARAVNLAGAPFSELLPADDLAALRLPQISHSAGRLDANRIRGGLETRYGIRPRALLQAATDPVMTAKILPDLADRLFGQPSPLAAAELMEASLNHPQELVRVSAATAYFDRSSEPDRLLGILKTGTRSMDELTRSVAATALAQLAPESKELSDLTTRKEGSAATGAASHTTVLVAGTWALNSPWWKPGVAGNFQSYLTTILPPLPRTPPVPSASAWSAPYAAADYYSWSGGYSDAARALAATDLVNWATAHSAPNADYITHSHGGNVAMLATQPGMAMTAQEMVLLSCPVHFPKDEPDFTKIQRIVSVRVRLDLVILADRGGQRFSDPRISENVLPVWFDHFATHDPAVWSKYKVPTML